MLLVRGRRRQHIGYRGTLCRFCGEAAASCELWGNPVEMEAATVARLAEAHGLQCSAIKAISDAAEFEFPALSRFHTKDGQFREAAFGAYVAVRPWLWGAVLEMARGSKLAAGNLCRELELEIQRQDEDSEVLGGS